MQKCAFNQRIVIGGNVMNGWVTFCKVIRAANPNNGDVDISQRLLDLFVVEVGNDAIS